MGSLGGLVTTVTALLISIQGSVGRQQRFLREPTDVTVIAGEQVGSVTQSDPVPDTGPKLSVLTENFYFSRLCCPAEWRTKRGYCSGLRMTLVLVPKETYQGRTSPTFAIVQHRGPGTQHFFQVSNLCHERSGPSKGLESCHRKCQLGG